MEYVDQRTLRTHETDALNNSTLHTYALPIRGITRSGTGRLTPVAQL